MRTLTPVPLTAEVFAPYGQVLDITQAEQLSINQGLTTRFHDMAQVRFDGEGAKTLINIFRSTPVSFPHRVQIMERHPLGSQAFYPIGGARFMVLVAPAGDSVRAEDLQLFITNGQQGVNFNPNTWHHYQLALDQISDFLVVDRGGEGNNLEEVELLGEAQVLPV
ncbi:MAG: ureidoglycolate lyase [Granulosicoccaceae bacterium]